MKGNVQSVFYGIAAVDDNTMNTTINSCYRYRKHTVLQLSGSLVCQINSICVVSNSKHFYIRIFTDELVAVL